MLIWSVLELSCLDSWFIMYYLFVVVDVAYLLIYTLLCVTLTGETNGFMTQC